MKRSAFPWILAYLGLLGSVGIAGVIWATAHGPAVSPDSVVYLEGAKSIASGQGYASAGETVTHFPPLFSVLLAAMAPARMDMVQAARFLNAFLFGVNVVLIGVATHVATERDRALTAGASLLFLFSGQSLILHASVLSEPLFIALALAAVALVPLYLARRDFGVLVLLAMAVGLSSLARYVGVALMPAILIVLLLGGRPPRLGQRLRDGCIFAIIACAPMALFTIRNALLSGAATDRHLVLHPASMPQVTALVHVLYGMLIPSLTHGWTRPAIILLVSVILIAALIVIATRRVRRGCWDSLADVATACCLLLSASYAVFLVASISLFDASTPIDARMLSPVFVWLVVGLCGAVRSLSALAGAPYLRGGFVLLIVLAAGVALPQTLANASRVRGNGEGYTSRDWQTSQTMHFVQGLPDGAKIYSNGPDAIRFASQKMSLMIPNQVAPTTLKTNDDYEGQISSVCDEVRAGEAYLVYFERITWRWYLPSPPKVAEMCQLPVLHRLEDGMVYGVAESEGIQRMGR